MACGNSAQTYYVDSLNGKNKNNGKSPDNAWKTLEKINSVDFRPGDSVLFRSNTILHGQLKMSGFGKADKPVVFSSYGKGPKPLIAGNGVMPAAVYIKNGQNFKLENLAVSNEGSQRKAGRAGVMIEIENYGKAENITLSNLDIFSVNGSLVKDEGGGSGILIKNGGDSIVSTFNNLLIEDCLIRRCERNAIIFSSYWNRQDWHPNTNVVIRNNLIEEVPGDGIVPIGCDGALIEHNIMRNSTRLLPEGEAAAGIWPWSCDNTIIQYNEVSDHKAPWDGQGFDSDWNCRNTIIQYNYSHNNEGGFILVCDDGNAGRDFSIGNQNTIIRYNISINDGNRKRPTRDGVFSPVIHFAGPAVNTRFYNNFIFHSGEESNSSDNTLIDITSWGGYADSVLFANNIFLSETPAPIKTKGGSNVRFEANYFNDLVKNISNNHGNIQGKMFFEKIKQKLNGRIKDLSVLKPGNEFKGKGKGRLIGPDDIIDFYGNPVKEEIRNIGIDQDIDR